MAIWIKIRIQENDILIKTFGGWAWSKEQSDFGDDSDHDQGPGFLEPDCDLHSGIFKELFFVYYCDFYSHPRIKHENARQRFELSECSLDVYMIQWVPAGVEKGGTHAPPHEKKTFISMFCFTRTSCQKCRRAVNIHKT